MVDTDEQFPYRIYGPQQDNSTVYVANVPPHSWPSDRADADVVPGVGLRERPDPADGPTARSSTATARASSDATTSRPGRSSTTGSIRSSATARTRRTCATASCGRRRSRSTRTTRRSSTTARSTCTKRSTAACTGRGSAPTSRRTTPEGHVTSGEPITRDMTGEEVYAALYSMRSSRLEPGVFWTGSNDGPVWMTRDGGKTWKNVTPTDLPPGGRVHTIEDSPHRRGSAYVSVYRMYLNDFKPYLYMTNDYGAALDAADRRHQRHPRRPADARRARGSAAGRAAVRRHARGRVRLVRSGQALAAAAAEPAGDAGHRHQGPPRTISSCRRWGGRSGSWTTSRRCVRSRRA